MANKNLQPIGSPLQPTRPPRLLSGKSGVATYNLQPKKGFAMLFSVLISSLLVAIGLSIFSLTLKELTISTSARESQVAFYAANSGMDCAIYWNFQDKFVESGGAVSPEVICGASSSVTDDGLAGGSTGFKFYITNNMDGTANINGPCVDVVVTKSTELDGSLKTVIESRGKNICGPSGRKVERGLTATIITITPVVVP